MGFSLDSDDRCLVRTFQIPIAPVTTSVNMKRYSPISESKPAKRNMNNGITIKRKVTIAQEGFPRKILFVR